MAKTFEEKLYDVRTVERYLKKGLVNKSDVTAYLKSLPNEQDNFELTTFEEDDLGLGDMSDEEVASLPPIKEEDIDNFDFLEDEKDAD